MTLLDNTTAPVRNTDRFFIGGEWVKPSTDATIDVIDSGTEQVFFRVAEAQAADMARAVEAARTAFDDGPWPRLTHAERAEYLRALAAGLRERASDFGQIWPRESGVLHAIARHSGAGSGGDVRVLRRPGRDVSVRGAGQPTAGGKFGLLVREPVGVVGAIIPWNGPLGLIAAKVAPALLAGCTVILKSSPEAPGEGYLVAEAAAAIGLPPGVLNVVTADREVSELLVRDPRVDKITFTGSTVAGRRIASICGERIARVHPRAGRQVGRRHPRRHRPRPPRPRRSPAPSACCPARCARRSPASSSPATATTSSLEALAGHVLAGRRRRPVRRARRRWARWRCSASATGWRATSPRASPRAPRWPPAAAVRSTSSGAGSSSRPCSATSNNASTIAQDEIFGPVLSVIPADDEADAIAHRQRHDLRPERVGVHPRRRTGPATSPASCARAPSATTPSGPTSACRSAGSSSPASAARAARKACCRSSRPSSSCSKAGPKATRPTDSGAPNSSDAA